MKATIDGYTTGKYDRPDAGNFTYRIPLDVPRFSEPNRAYNRMLALDKLGKRWIVQDPKDVHNKNPNRYAIFQTRDNKGRVPNMGKYEHSKEWRDFPSGPGKWEGLEMRNGSHGGTQLQGEVYVGNEIFKRVWTKTTVDLTPTEIEAAYSTGENEDEVMDTLWEAIDWASREALDEALSEYHKEMKEKYPEEYDEEAMMYI